ncbi:MAG: hypothetical protein AAFO07_25130 [Bacteroidota bacterium]
MKSYIILLTSAFLLVFLGALMKLENFNGHQAALILGLLCLLAALIAFVLGETQKKKRSV